MRYWKFEPEVCLPVTWPVKAKCWGKHIGEEFEQDFQLESGPKWGMPSLLMQDCTFNLYPCSIYIGLCYLYRAPQGARLGGSNDQVNRDPG